MDYGGGGDSDSATGDSQIHQTDDGGPNGSDGEGRGGDIAEREEKYKPRRESDLARWKQGRWQKVKLKCNDLRIGKECEETLGDEVDLGESPIENNFHSIFHYKHTRNKPF